MKLLPVALATLLASSAQGFSVTMSSMGYLDRIASGSSQLSSFGNSASSSYAAPQTYSTEIPANNDLQYLKSLGGGNAMKSGRNYAGVSSSFRSSEASSPYLDALRGKTMAQEPYSTQPVASQSYATPDPAPYSYTESTPVSNDLNYMKTLGGGNAMKSGPNYSGVSKAFKGTSGSLYQPSMGAEAQQYSAPVSAPASYSESVSVNSDLNYMKTLGGGNAMKSGSNYAGVSRSFKIVKDNSYLAAVASVTPAYAQPAQASYVDSTPASTDLNYMKTLGGGSAMKSGGSYAGVSRSFKTVADNSYLGAMTTSQPSYTEPAQASYVDNSPASTDLNYMRTLGGGSAMKSGPNYSGVSRSFRSGNDNTYLGAVASVPPAYAEPAQASYVDSTPASTDLNYMRTLGGGNAMKSGPNYSGVSRSFRPGNDNTYLGAVATVAPAYAEPAQASYVDNTPASTDLNYMKTLGGGNAMKSGPNYSGVSRSFRSGNDNTYLGAVASVAPAYAEPAQASYVDNTPASTDLNYMKTLGGGNAMKSGPNYSGVSRSFKSGSDNTYLGAVASVTPAYAQPAQSSYVDSTPASTDLNYMKTLGGGNAMKSGPNYSGVSRSFRSGNDNTYLGAVASVTPAYAEPAQASYVDNTPASTDLNYMRTLGGGNSMKSGPNYSGVSRSYNAVNNDNSYLGAIKGQSNAYAAATSYAAPSSYAAPAPAPATYVDSTPANSDLNYIKALGGGNAMKSGPNYSGVSRSFQAKTNDNTYLSELKGPSVDYYSAPQTYTAPTPAPLNGQSYGVPETSYNNNYSGSAPADTYLDSVSSTYSSMHSSFARATSNYMGVNPNPRAARSAFGAYLDNI